MMKYINFDNMTGNALVIAGDADLNTNFSDRLSYRWDAYTCSPAGNKTLLTFAGGEHMFPGDTGWETALSALESQQGPMATVAAK